MARFKSDKRFVGLTHAFSTDCFYSEMQEKMTRNAILQRRRLGCQTQRFRRPVGLLGLQPNKPTVSLFYTFQPYKIIGVLLGCA